MARALERLRRGLICALLHESRALQSQDSLSCFDELQRSVRVRTLHAAAGPSRGTEIASGLRSRTGTVDFPSTLCAEVHNTCPSSARLSSKPHSRRLAHTATWCVTAYFSHTSHPGGFHPAPNLSSFARAFRPSAWSQVPSPVSWLHKPVFQFECLVKEHLIGRLPSTAIAGRWRPCVQAGQKASSRRSRQAAPTCSCSSRLDRL